MQKGVIELLDNIIELNSDSKVSTSMFLLVLFIFFKDW
jgi:hypothetical protein